MVYLGCNRKRRQESIKESQVHTPQIAVHVNFREETFQKKSANVFEFVVHTFENLSGICLGQIQDDLESVNYWASQVKVLHDIGYLVEVY